jgi:predicted AlkP superfamily pyrophosphatase or phosphodiesterase
MNKKLVIIQAAGLGYDFIRKSQGTSWQGLEFHPIECVFPAVTCSVQASFRTASPPATHGMVANGLFHRELRRPLLWEQSSALVSGPRIWESFRARGKKVALLFWQQSLGEPVDMLLSPAPVHKHGGGMVQSVYSQPAGLYEAVCKKLGKRFQLHRYWGPIASAASSEWIARATAAVLDASNVAPDLCLTYLPSLDYDLQRHGPDHPAAKRALGALLEQITVIREAASRNHYDVVVFGDYAIAPVSHAIFPNVALHDAGLFKTRTVDGMLYPDFHTSAAFAMVDHEIAHVYLKDKASATAVRNALAKLNDIAQVLGPDEQRPAGIEHPNCGDLVLVAAPGAWFAYPWWTSKKSAPDYASHVDIHNKPGYDPCELFFGWPPISVSQDTSRIKGSHGRTGSGSMAAMASTIPFPDPPKSLLELAERIHQHLDTIP